MPSRWRVENPALDVGRASGSGGQRRFPATVAQLIRQIALGRIRIYDELAAQVRKVQERRAFSPRHLDTHKHTHLLPPVLNAVARIASEFQIPWVRRPFDLPLHGAGVPWRRQAVSKALGFARARFHRVLDAPRMPHHRSFCWISDHRAL